MAVPKIGGSHPLPKCVQFWWRMIGLCPFALVDDGTIRFTREGYIYANALILAYGTLYSKALVHRINFVLPRETSMTIVSDFASLSAEFLMIVASWSCFAFRRNELRKISEMLKNVSANSISIGIGQSCCKIGRKVQIHVIVINLVWLCVFCCDHALLYGNESFKYAVWVPFNITRIVSHNVVIVFVNALAIMRNYFRRLNGKIDNLPGEGTPNLRLLPRRPTSSKHHGLETYAKPGPLEIYGQMHSDLVTLTKMIVHFFSLPMVLMVLVLITQMATDLYIICMLIKLEKVWSTRDAFAFVILCCWFSGHFALTVALLVISDSTVNEANQAGSRLHNMLAADGTRKYVNVAEILSLRLLHRRLSISLWGLLEMRLSLIHMIIGTVGTYITVMMQLDIQNHQREALGEQTNQSTTPLDID